nr:EOG090X05NZ [Lepidurus arcticus]
MIGWLVFGRLRDPFKEFFVIHASSNQSKDATQALNVGEMINLYLQSNSESDEAEELDVLKQIQNARNNWECSLEVARIRVAKRMWRLVVTDGKAKASMTTIHNFFLMGRGELFIELLDNAARYLDVVPGATTQTQFQRLLVQSATRVLRDEDEELENITVKIDPVPDPNNEGQLTSNVPPARSIYSKAMKHRMSLEPKPAPFPYKDKKFGLWQKFFDSTTSRFDENSKLIVVEGPPAVGKGALAKALADELDMLYVPSANMDLEYVSETGVDIRQYDHLFPESLKSFDETKFLENPASKKSIVFQLQKYQNRLEKHIEALAHILNTGQGVVMDRCPHSDAVYIEAMCSQGFITKRMRDYYYDVRKNTITEVFRPHLVLYLDVPVPQVQKQIKARNLPYEVNSPATSAAYLKALEEAYKHKYLKEISTHAELLVYDWSEKGDVEVVVEDIERIDLDRFQKDDPKMKDWRYKDEWLWADQRALFTSHPEQILCYLNVPNTSLPEVWIEPEDVETYLTIRAKAWNTRKVFEYIKTKNSTNYLIFIEIPTF